MKKILFAVVAVLAVVSLASSGSAAGKAKRSYQAPQESSSRQGHFDVGGGFGLTVRSPVQFDINTGVRYFLWEDISLGLDVDTLIRGTTAFAVTAGGRYHFDIPPLPELVPYAGLGLGGVFDVNGGKAMNISVPDLGFDYEILHNFFLGPEFSVNILTDFEDTTWNVRILFVKATYRF
ncbi:MAG: hypothetical protein HYS22_03945 [Deltaproteobacteria bacterium]|nr:hypothetical protein [Deltaproteobacteria bacterium]